MTPAQHPNERIAERFRRLIRDGADGYTAGSRLPPVREIAESEGVATATVRNAMSWLRVEGYIVTTQRGSFVADVPDAADTPHDRLGRIARTGSVLADGETKQVLSAAPVVPPLYVTELFDLDPMSRVIRREYVVGTGPRRTMLAVDWFPTDLADAVPDLLSTAPGRSVEGRPGRGDDLIAQIEQATGRRVHCGRDAMHARTADQREAGHLGLAVGTPILAGAHEWSDDQGVICYGEWCLPPRLTIGYEYEV